MHPQNQICSNADEVRQIQKFPNGVPFEELAKHNKPDDAWMSVNFNVYDVTNYIQRHPGGSVILKGIGKESTNLFNKYHSWVNAEYILKDYFVGRLKLI